MVKNTYRYIFFNLQLFQPIFIYFPFIDSSLQSAAMVFSWCSLTGNEFCGYWLPWSPFPKHFSKELVFTRSIFKNFAGIEIFWDSLISLLDIHFLLRTLNIFYLFFTFEKYSYVFQAMVFVTNFRCYLIIWYFMHATEGQMTSNFARETHRASSIVKYVPRFFLTSYF